MLIAEICNYYLHANLIKCFIVLNVRDEIESKYPSIVFLSIVLLQTVKSQMKCNMASPYLPRQNHSLEKEVQYFGSITYDPSIYTMDHSDLTI